MTSSDLIDTSHTIAPTQTISEDNRAVHEEEGSAHYDSFTDRCHELLVSHPEIAFLVLCLQIKKQTEYHMHANLYDVMRC